MRVMNQLSSIVDLLDGAGNVMEGATMTEGDAKDYVRQRFPNTGYCIVRNWIWLDIDLPDGGDELFERIGRKPVVIYAHDVVYDSMARWSPGSFVSTSYLRDFYDGYLFQTDKTVYVLLGDGLQKRVSWKALTQIME